MTSTPTSSKKKTTMRMPTMAPVPRPEPPPVASEGQGQGEEMHKHNRQERGVRGERNGFNTAKRGAEGKLERERGRDDEGCSQALNPQLQVPVMKTSSVLLLSEAIWRQIKPEQTGILTSRSTVTPSAFTRAT